jgi:hypothetical protein
MEAPQCVQATGQATRPPNGTQGRRAEGSYLRPRHENPSCPSILLASLFIHQTPTTNPPTTTMQAQPVVYAQPQPTVVVVQQEQKKGANHLVSALRCRFSFFFSQGGREERERTGGRRACALTAPSFLSTPLACLFVAG